jgi:hypothetical protein
MTKASIKHLTLTPQHWDSVLMKIKDEYNPSVYLIRERMQKTLGFTVRRHQEWIDRSQTPGDDLDSGYYLESVHLDFYDDAKKTWFLLKYSDIINSD